MKHVSTANATIKHFLVSVSFALPLFSGGQAVATVIINEVLASHTGSDDTEFVELFGALGESLDVKGWGEKNGFCKIGDGDVNWPEVRKALAEIGFGGWCTAEVGGGGRERLVDIAARVDRVLGL